MQHPAAFLLLLLFAPFTWASDDVAVLKCAGQHGAKVVSLQGTLEYDPENKGRWIPIQLNQILCEGSRIHVGVFSRASILLPNGFVARIDEDTVLTFNVLNPEKTTLMDLLKGFVHFISRTPKHLQINTPIANAGPEGTEFALSVSDNSASLWVYEGGVKFFNTKGSLHLSPEQGARAYAGQTPQPRIDIKPQDAVNWALYYPPLIPYPEPSQTIDNDIRTAIRDFCQGRVVAAITRLDDLPSEKNTLLFYKVRGAMRLTLGRIDLALQDIRAILKQNANDADALALQSVLALTQNRKEEAYALATRAILANPVSATAYSALSYAEQGRFELEKALKAADQAVKNASHDAMMWARKAELELALGLASDSEDTVAEAAKRDAALERTQTVIGFTHLQQMDAKEAMQAFDKALQLDSTSPLARLGLGLAKIRNGNLAEGRQDLEIAATLDPNNSLIRSYLGKAYYEENRNPLAEDQFKLAKERDPKDPTPYFYDALKKQTENRPVEALHELQKAIALNDNRAIYRSKQLLDSDRAARGASLARIYDNLGFEQRGAVEATSSLQLDPTNFSAHRFLSDTYVNQSGRETAQLSELLQAKLLQPININPVQPHLSVSQRGLLNASGIDNSSFQDFTRVFEGNRPQLLVSGIAGNQGVLGDETTLSGIVNKFSYSLGQFHYQTDGFTRPYGDIRDRRNTAQRNNIYDAFFQWAVTDRINTQFEYTNRETKQGTLQQNLAANDSDSYSEQDFLRDSSYRLGLNLKVFTDAHLVASYVHTDNFINTLDPSLFTDTKNHKLTDFYEAQYLRKQELYNLITGFAYYNTKLRSTDFPGFNIQFGHREYTYLNLKLSSRLTGTLGLSYDSIDKNEEVDFQHAYPKTGIYPKAGLLWDANKHLKLRLAYIRENKWPIAAVQTIEPTQVAGFNQFFDDLAGKYYSFYGGAVDLVFNSNIFSGAELSRKDLYNLEGGNLFSQKNIAKAYFNWTITDRLSLSTQYRYMRDFFPDNFNPREFITQIVPLELRYFDPSGFFGKVTGSYVNQNSVESSNILGQQKNSDSFFLLDSSVGYRFPKRLGIISLEAKNIFNNKFRFEDLNEYENNQFFNSALFLPQRTIFGRITFNF